MLTTRKKSTGSDVSATAEEPIKKYMCVNPYEGFVCKRDGNHAGVAMPNFRTCYAIIIRTSDFLLALHYPSRVYSKRLPDDLKKWITLFKEKTEEAFIVLNKNFAAWGSSTEHNIVNFQARLNKDIGLKFTVVEASGSGGDELLIADVAGTVNLRSNNILTHPENYANWPRHPASRLRYYTCRAQFFTKNDDFPVIILGSKNFFVPPDEKEWPVCINEHVQLLREKKLSAMQTISEELIKASIDKTNEKYPWAIAIGLEGLGLPTNLKHYLYLLLSLMHLVDQTVELEPLKEQVESIHKTLNLR